MCRYYCTLMITLCGYYYILMITIYVYITAQFMLTLSVGYYCIIMITLCGDITAYLW